MRGYNLSDLAEEGYSFSDALFVLFQNRIPTEKEEKMLKYEMGVFLEHSMSPSAAGAIGVSAGRPNLPVTVAASISTFGGVHGPGAAHGYMLNKYLERAEKEGKTPEEMAKTLVDEYMDAKRPVMGMGQPQHVDSDPRAEPIHQPAHVGQAKSGDQCGESIGGGYGGGGDAQIGLNMHQEDAEGVGLPRSADKNAQRGHGQDDPAVKEPLADIKSE